MYLIPLLNEGYNFLLVDEHFIFDSETNKIDFVICSVWNEKISIQVKISKQTLHEYNVLK